MPDNELESGPCMPDNELKSGLCASDNEDGLCDGAAIPVVDTFVSVEGVSLSGVNAMTVSSEAGAAVRTDACML